MEDFQILYDFRIGNGANLVRVQLLQMSIPNIIIDNETF